MLKESISPENLNESTKKTEQEKVKYLPSSPEEEIEIEGMTEEEIKRVKKEAKPSKKEEEEAEKEKKSWEKKKRGE